LEPPNLKRTWHRDAASSKLASEGLIDLSKSYGEPLFLVMSIGNYLLLFEVYQVFVILVYSNIRECSPALLNLLSGYILFTLLLLLSLSLQVSSPCPLNLDSSNVVHRETVVLKKPSGQTHLICSLNQGRTEILHTSIFVFCQHIKWRC
jgi:hypothetical protein